MTREIKHRVSAVIRYTLLIAVGFVMLYPLLWMISATFKTNAEIFTNIGLIPKNFTVEGYSDLTRTIGGDINIIRAMINTYSIVIPKVIFTLISATITAYGFARFKFIGSKVLFAVMMSTLFLPQVVLNVPQFILFTKLGWVGHPLYLALIVPALCATDTYFVFMLIQFMRGIPRELEEAAKIDGCNSLQTLYLIISPMLKPALVSVALFQFMWTNNDFMGPLLYVNDPKKYTASIFLKMVIGSDTSTEWNRVLALSLISITPSIIIFLLAQNSFIDGIAAGSVKG